MKDESEKKPFLIHPSSFILHPFEILHPSSFDFFPLIRRPGVVR